MPLKLFFKPYFSTEREGFEPSNKSPRYSISSAAPSTTRPPLQATYSYPLYMVDYFCQKIEDLFFAVDYTVAKKVILIVLIYFKFNE